MARRAATPGIRAVLFDLGDTLVNTSAPELAVSAALSVGLDVDAEAVHHTFREVEKEFDDAWGRMDLTTFWMEVLSRANGAPISRDRARAVMERADRMAPRHELYSDVVRCLDALGERGHRLGVISNGKSEANTRGILERVGILDRFRVVVSSGTEGVAKPEPEIFRRGAERIGVDAGRCAYVGNLANVDARAASRAGMFGVWLNRRGVGLGDDPPEITSLTELPFLIAEHRDALVK